MDDPTLEVGLHQQALRGLERINALSVQLEPIWRQVRSLFHETGHQPIRLLDVATGAGDLTVRMAQRARREALPLTVAGCDKSKTALAHAQERARMRGVNVRFFPLDIFKDTIPEFDVVVSTLFLHHLGSDETVRFLGNLRASAKKMIVISDLRRSALGWLAAYLVSRIVSRSPVIHYDAPQSVRAAYTMGEIRALCRAAGLRDAEIRPIWPFRFLLVWRRR